MRTLKLLNKLKPVAKCGIICGLIIFWIQDAAASTGDQSLSSIVTNVQTNVTSLAPLLTIISYIAGIAFAIAGIVKFKAHKDNPAQAQLSQAIVYLGVGAALLFLPSVLSTAGSTLFGQGGGTSAGKGSTGLSN